MIHPPAVRGASYRGAVRWYVACPGERVPIVFDAGWDAAREAILARQIDAGLLPPGTELSARPDWVPAWADLDDCRIARV